MTIDRDLIVFDASAVISPALKADSIPEQALPDAEGADVFALSTAVDAEIAEVLRRPGSARILSPERRGEILQILRGEAAVRFDATVRITECRDPRDHEYLELALAAGAEIIVVSDGDLVVLYPLRGVRILRPASHLAF